MEIQSILVINNNRKVTFGFCWQMLQWFQNTPFWYWHSNKSWNTEI